MYGLRLTLSTHRTTASLDVAALCNNSKIIMKRLMVEILGAKVRIIKKYYYSHLHNYGQLLVLLQLCVMMKRLMVEILSQLVLK